MAAGSYENARPCPVADGGAGRVRRPHRQGLKAHLAARDRALPGYVEREFEDYLRCGRLEHDFLRVRCERCRVDRLVAFSCKRRGFCPSRGAQRMAESAALLVDEVFPEQPVRQWVLSVPHPLRYLFASRPEVMSRVLGIVYRCIATHLIHKAGCSRKSAQDRRGHADSALRQCAESQHPLPHAVSRRGVRRGC